MIILNYGLSSSSSTDPLAWSFTSTLLAALFLNLFLQFSVHKKRIVLTLKISPYKSVQNLAARCMFKALCLIFWVKRTRSQYKTVPCNITIPTVKIVNELVKCFLQQRAPHLQRRASFSELNSVTWGTLVHTSS